VERVVDDAGFRRLSAELGALTRGQRRRIRSALDRLDEAAKVAAKPLPVGPAAGRARGAIATPHGGAVAVDAPGRGAFGSDLGPSEVGQSGTHASDARPGGAGSTGAGANDAGPRNACAISVGPSGERASGAPPAGAPGSALCGGERPAAGPDFGFFRSKRTASHRGFGYSASPPIPAAGDLAPSAARDAGARRGCQAAGDLDDRRQCHDGDPSRSAGTGTGCRRQHGGHGEATRPSTPAIAPSVPSFARIRLPDAFQRVRDDMLHSRRPGTCRALAASLAIDKTTVWRWRRRIMGTLHAAPLLQTPGSRTRSNGAGASPAAGKRLRESRQGSRLWVNHRNDPLAAPVPHRPRWVDVDRGGEPLPRPLWTFQHIVALGIDPDGRCHATVLPAGPPADDGLRWRAAGGDSLATSRSTRPGLAAAAGLPRSRIGLPGAPADHADEPPAERLVAAFEQFLGPFRGPGAAHLDGYAAWFATRLDAATTGWRHDGSTDVAITSVSGAWASRA
jgi:hypothetical protein